jgi:hypothetical protein
MFNGRQQMEPDGPEERIADAEERAWFEDDDLTLAEQLADESRDDPDNWETT